MKHSSTEENNSENHRRKDGSSLRSRLYRASMQLAQRLDIQIRSVTEWQELFHPETIAVRQRLRLQCEQLMFNHAKEYGRKTEELLWRKVFYDVIQMLRQQRKATVEDQALDSAFRTHLVSASGYYHHLLLQLQLKYKVQLDGIVSWGNIEAKTLIGSLVDGIDPDVQDWALKACQRCLICLGDLARYQQDVDGEQKAIIAKRFYSEAVLVNPHLGMPHNQLGTLCGNQFYGCEGAYYYMRCLLSKQVFEGAEGNLLRLFERNRNALQRIKELPDDASEEDRVKRFLVYFLHLQDVLYGHESSPEISSDEVGQLCQSVLQDLTAALVTDPAPPEPSNSAGSAHSNGDLAEVTSPSERSDGIITSSLMVKLVTMAIMAVTILENKGSPQTSMATAFNLAFLSQLLQHCISWLEHPERHAASQSAPAAQKSAPVQNGLDNHGFGGCNGHEEDHAKLRKVKKIKKALKQRRRRRRQISGDSVGSGSGSDLEEHSFDHDDNDSDLSEGGEAGEFNDNGPSSDEDSDDVYVESESENDSEPHSSAPRTLFFSSRAGATDALKEAGKLLTQQVTHKQAWESGLSKQNGFVFNRTSKMEHSSDVSDAETEASFASSIRTTLSVDLRDSPESSLLRAVVRDKLLPSVKVLTDWLRVNPDVITTCVESSSSLLARLASLLNLLPSPEQISSAVAGSKLSLWGSLFHEKLDAEWTQSRVLPEDICLLGFSPLQDLHSNLDLKWNRPPKDSKYLEAAVRIQCLTSFGKQLSSIEALEAFNWDENAQKFVGPRQLTPVREKPNKVKNDAGLAASQAQERRARVMKAMAQQKLQSDVADLEQTLKATQPNNSTAYLVPDAPALCTQLHLIMRLVGSERFLLIIPLQVIAALDELKKYDSGAREAIKYLEGEFKRGNRWVRAQKESEAVENNKKRGRYEDVAVWRFNQIVNCCRYMVNQAGRGLVTLLTGNASYETPRRGQKRAVTSSGTQATPEGVEMARRCGVNVESLRVFCARLSGVKAVT